MGIFSDVVRGLNVFSRSSSGGSKAFKTPKGAIRLDEYQRAVGLHQQIKKLLKEKERSERRMSQYAGVQLAKSQRPEKIDEILEQDRMVPQYRRLKNKWLNTSDATQRQLIELTGTRPPWESDRLHLD